MPPSLHRPLRDAGRPYGVRAGALALRRMEPAPGTPRPALSVVPRSPRVDRDALRDAIADCIAARPDGLPPADLVPSVAARLGVDGDELEERDIDAALGMLVVTGRVDEAAGRLVAVAQDTRATG